MTDSILNRILGERILILDGAMGTMIQEYDFSEKDYRGDKYKDIENPIKGNNDILSITQPDVISEIHEKYLIAGADILETNTFSGTSIAQSDYNLENEVYRINYESAVLAKKAAQKYSSEEKPRFVAGAIGPTNKTASISPDIDNPSFRSITFDELAISYQQQCEALIDGRVDIFLIETVFDTLNAKAAMFACQEAMKKKNVHIPIMLSGTITDISGRTLSGQTTEAFLISVSHVPLLSIGLNCALGAEQILPYLQILSDKSEFNISVHPNAGLPNAFGQYDETPEMMGEKIEEFFKRGLINIVGGCCGTTPDHIAEISRISKNYTRRIF
ncbi:5-methyltetrahydrofolate--homocysteine methyltransferase [Ichthyobacterium seriolicida]|uniref:Methionine synthase n=1 Tax=Ichthyobacterium seriolicida TaxID=242600 RepID=A0A1J1DYW4_9FLAO|nr:homocysteine S-methyltransferase family protein [Ichthyobacterium seriolicida]BAV95114.1 5-methyltetrahydrofolate--homocysteine methyltransferase [Ichthyobacterium seriolicida]